MKKLHIYINEQWLVSTDSTLKDKLSSALGIALQNKLNLKREPAITLMERLRKELMLPIRARKKLLELLPKEVSMLQRKNNLESQGDKIWIGGTGKDEHSTTDARIELSYHRLGSKLVITTINNRPLSNPLLLKSLIKPENSRQKQAGKSKKVHGFSSIDKEVLKALEKHNSIARKDYSTILTAINTQTYLDGSQATNYRRINKFGISPVKNQKKEMVSEFTREEVQRLKSIRKNVGTKKQKLITTPITRTTYYYLITNGDRSYLLKSYQGLSQQQRFKSRLEKKELITHNNTPADQLYIIVINSIKAGFIESESALINELGNKNQIKNEKDLLTAIKQSPSLKRSKANTQNWKDTANIKVVWTNYPFKDVDVLKTESTIQSNQYHSPKSNVNWADVYLEQELSKIEKSKQNQNKLATKKQRRKPHSKKTQKIITAFHKSKTTSSK
ncbi:TPA: hypothetical protein NGT30_002510 [Vibrio parahaemolyticus]|nr:hypothetical protein [Vibrio parahaemolyticus]HCE4677505.1 hypothetical protein [Vibrio parahaemolyticus]